MTHMHAASASMIIALAFGLADPAFAAYGDEVEYQCEAPLRGSSAGGSCSALNLAENPEGTCHGLVICRNSSGGSTANNGAWKLDSLSKMVNENGVLTGGTPVGKISVKPMP
ncbi:MAG TPA: hypothetical protein DIT18_07510 [Pseudomonas sp.]|nr:hypothetical protein [Pseudomonas sp.]